MINPFNEFEDLFFSVFDASVFDVSRCVEKRWNLIVDEDEDEHEHDQTSMKMSGRYILTPADLDFSYAYLNTPTPPVRSGWDPSQLLFWEPRSSPGRTVMMTNAICGNSHAVFRMSEAVPWECVYVRMPGSDGMLSTFMFNYYRDYRRIARSLGIGREENGRWLCCLDGPVQPFENPDYYLRRRIRDRLNREVITEYLQKLGYDITKNEFWTSDSQAWLIWDNWNGQRSGPGRDGIEVEGTRAGWRPQ